MENITTLSKSERLEKLQAFHHQNVVGPRILGNEEATATVVANGLLTFTKGVSRAFRQDVKNAYLYATMAADKKHGSYAAGEDWYKTFCQVMALAGWVAKETSYRAHTTQEKHLSMEKVAIEILRGAIISAAMGPAGTLEALDAAYKAVAVVAKDDAALKLFDRSAKTDSGANFGIGSVVEEDGDVCVALGMVQYTGHETKTSVLFTNWDSSSLNIYQAKTVFWMDENGVEDARDLIRASIAEARQRKMAELSI